MGTRVEVVQPEASGIESLEAYLERQRSKINQCLDEVFQEPRNPVTKAACYSLFSASKRIRPIFALEVCRAICGDENKAMPVAQALEMLHTYSLVHDDLPAMDNDDLRRGKPTNHKVYGEARAILAGDGLLTKAFEVLAGSGSAPDLVRIRWIKVLAIAAGMDGMVLGQDMDIGVEEPANLELLESLHRKKTGALLSASVVMGAIAAEAPRPTVEALREFAMDMGLAFQIQDDVLDVIGGKELGKTAKSDEKNEKLTYVSLLGLDKAGAEGKRWYQKALDVLRTLSFPHSHRLEELTRFVIERKF